ncbi:hypothetical protein EFE41_00050 [Methanohalophilus portucalensis FDF-1]|uniref:Uncharacterized protein n=2 Tax=Methanohalophilus portucalensis TaxID=39664 RepID=A0A3M9LIC1_9EURY|nr:hypothetical protein BKM01_08455 [Methanohalophilus portucalensis]RNI13026.1 hypothetical protein EFE41_00050 [Methanohalophilus portucalensis FDF-1]
MKEQERGVMDRENGSTANSGNLYGATYYRVFHTPSSLHHILRISVLRLYLWKIYQAIFTMPGFAAPPPEYSSDII